MNHELHYRVSELERQLANLCFVTAISSVDPAQKQFRVRIGADESALLPWPADIRLHSISWKPLKVGQQVLVACPSGDPAQAVVVQFLYSEAIDAPSNDDGIELTKFADGSTLKYSAGASELSFAGTLKIQAATSITLDTPLVTTTQKLTAKGLFSYMSGMAGQAGSGEGGGTTISGPISHEGSYTLKGRFTHEGSFYNQGEIVSNGVVLHLHQHGGVKSGGEQSGGPQ